MRFAGLAPVPTGGGARVASALTRRGPDLCPKAASSSHITPRGQEARLVTVAQVVYASAAVLKRGQLYTGREER
ncbi:hypothetical protein ACFU3E_09385 [Streptomyces sp. NPDC057424]|uniref:hypothetical protein n=1 Tax=Streptomyces sp. NPDC057424 TaxID=3346127 RepID=UPI00369B8541